MGQYVTVAEVTGLMTVHGQLVMIRVVAWSGVELALGAHAGVGSDMSRF